MMLKASLYNKMIYLIRQNRDSKIRDFNNHATKQMKGSKDPTNTMGHFLHISD